MDALYNLLTLMVQLAAVAISGSAQPYLPAGDPAVGAGGYSGWTLAGGISAAGVLGPLAVWVVRRAFAAGREVQRNEDRLAAVERGGGSRPAALAGECGGEDGELERRLASAEARLAEAEARERALSERVVRLDAEAMHQDATTGSLRAEVHALRDEVRAAHREIREDLRQLRTEIVAILGAGAKP